MAFLVSFYRAKFGLPLSQYDKYILTEEHKLSPGLTIQWTPEEIEFARRQGLEASSPSSKILSNDGSLFPNLSENYPLPTITTTTQQTSGEPSVVPEISRRNNEIIMNTATTTTTATTENDDERQQEAETIMTLLTGLVQQANHCLSINELSDRLAHTSGASWGQYWENRHGPLLFFLRKYMRPGYTLMDNHWFGFEGMVSPVTNDTYPSHSSSSLVLSGGTMTPPPPTESVYTLPQSSTLLLEDTQDQSNCSNNWINYDIEKFDQALTVKREQELKEQEHRLQFQFDKEAEEERERKHQQQLQQLVLRHQLQQQRSKEERNNDDELRLIESIRRELTIEQDNRNRQIAEDALLARRIAEEEHLAMTASTGMNTGASQAAIELRRNRILDTVPKASVFLASPPPSTASMPMNYQPTLSTPYPYPSSHHRPVSSSLSSTYGGYTGNTGGRIDSSIYNVTPSHSSTFSTDSNTLMVPHHRMNTSTGTSSGMVPYATVRPHSTQPTWDAELFATQSIQRLGGTCEGDDVNITPADFDVLFRPMLVHGFTLIKHGRSGPPKKRRFWMTNSLSRLWWDSAKFFDVVIGTGERCIEMSSVIQIIDGVGTDLLRRKLATGSIYSGHEGRFFSLVTTDRTFDLECSSKNQQTILVRAINWITNRDKRLSNPPYIPIAPTLPPPPSSLFLLGNGSTSVTSSYPSSAVQGNGTAYNYGSNTAYLRPNTSGNPTNYPPNSNYRSSSSSYGTGNPYGFPP